MDIISKIFLSIMVVQRNILNLKYGYFLHTFSDDIQKAEINYIKEKYTNQNFQYERYPQFDVMKPHLCLSCSQKHCADPKKIIFQVCTKVWSSLSLTKVVWTHSGVLYTRAGVCASRQFHATSWRVSAPAGSSAIGARRRRAIGVRRRRTIGVGSKELMYIKRFRTQSDGFRVCSRIRGRGTARWKALGA